MQKLNRGWFHQTTSRLQLARISLLSILIICAASACSASGQSAAPVGTQPPAPTALPPAAPTETRLTPTAGVAPPASPKAQPIAPAVEPTTSAYEAWKTYTSAALHIALKYSPGWQVKEDASGITFSSMGGSTIKLLQMQTGDLSPQAYLDQSDLPNTRCSLKTNPSGLSARVCFDTIAFSTTADFISGTGANAKLLALVMGKSGDQSVFDAMLQTLRVTR